MIREILPDCGGQVREGVLTMYRMWHCFDCGLEFSMKTLAKPKACPVCLIGFLKEGVTYPSNENAECAHGVSCELSCLSCNRMGVKEYLYFH